MYEEAEEAAREAIDTLGKPATLVRMIRSGPPHDPQTAEQLYPVHVVETGYSLKNRDTSLVQAGDKLGLISTSCESPELSDQIIIDGRRYKFIDVQPLNPGGLTLLYDFHARA